MRETENVTERVIVTCIKRKTESEKESVSVCVGKREKQRKQKEQMKRRHIQLIQIA